MAVDTAFNDKIKKYAEDLINQRSAYADYAAKQAAGGWGGSSDDYAHWGRVAAENRSTAEGLRGNYAVVAGLLDKGHIGPDQEALIMDAISKGGTDLQGLREYGMIEGQRLGQSKQLEDFRTRAEEQLFGGPNMSLKDSLTNNLGEIGQLNQFLGNQEQDIFRNELAPEINNMLGASGLYDSGASYELKGKALAGLQRDREANLTQYALNSKNYIRGLGREDIGADLDSQHAKLSGLFEMQRAGITMGYQAALSARREQLMRELSSYRGSPSLLSQIVGFGGAAASVAAAPFVGGTSLPLVPGFLNYAQTPG